MTKISRTKLAIIICIGLLYLLMLYTREFNRAKKLISLPYCQCHEDDSRGTTNTQGKLCLYRWESTDSCLNHIGDLRKLSTFPHNPTICQPIDQFLAQFDGGSHGQRIFGYVHPNSTSHYQFALVADDGGELWLSHDSNPDNARKIAQVDRRLDHKQGKNPLQQQISDLIYLKKGQKYWIEALHTRATGRGFIKVGWKTSQKTKSTAIYHTVGKPLISLPTNYAKISKYHSQSINSTKPSQPARIEKMSSDQSVKWKRKFNILPRFDQRYIDEALKFCSYGRPSYVLPPDYSLNTFNIIYYLQTIEYRVYGRFKPIYHSSNIQKLPNDVSQMDQEEAKLIVHSLLNHINHKNKGKFELVHIYGVEQKSDRARGNRYLVDIVIKQKFNKKLYRISEYLYKYRSTDKMCKLVDLQWNQKVHVYIVIMIANENINTFQFFLAQLQRYYKHSRDYQFTLIVVGSSKVSVQLQTRLQDSKLKKYRFLEVDSQILLYSRKAAFHMALSSIPNSNSIILQYDNLHLNFPMDLMENVRKRCFPGKMAYMPISFRFQCGANAENLSGYWQNHHFNLAAFYLSDYNRAVKFDVRSLNPFHLQGDDTEFVVKLLMKQLEIERLHYPGLYQFDNQQMTLLKNQILS